MTKSPKIWPPRKFPTYQTFIQFLLWVSFLLVLTACGGTPTTTSQPSTTVAVGGTTLYITPASLDFGSVQPSSEAATRTLTLTNTGIRSVTIASSIVSPTAVFTVPDATGPVTLAPSKTLQLQVAFAPKNDGTYSGTLLLATAGLSPTLLNVSSPASPSVPLLVKLPLSGIAN